MFTWPLVLVGRFGRLDSTGRSIPGYSTDRTLALQRTASVRSNRGELDREANGRQPVSHDSAIGKLVGDDAAATSVKRRISPDGARIYAAGQFLQRPIWPEPRRKRRGSTAIERRIRLPRFLDQLSVSGGIPAARL